MRLPTYVREYQGVCVGLLAVGGFIAYQLWWPSEPTQPRAQQPKQERVVRASVDEQRSLHGQVDALKGQVGQLVDGLTGMTRAVHDLQQQLGESKEQAKQERERLKHEAAQREQRLRDEADRERQRQSKTVKATTQGTLKPQATVATPPPAPAAFELRTIGTSQARPKHAPAPVTHHLDTAFLPSGCYAKIKLVTGVSATSQLGSGGASWGHPILYVVDEAFECARKLDEIGTPAMRERTAVPLDGCLGFATGKADLASSRVQGEAVLLSCVMPDAAGFEVPIKGYLVGQDGKQGLFGVIRTHESAKVGAAFLSGMIQEAAAFFSAARKGATITVTGQSVPGSGMESTLKKVGDYWLEQARALQPTLDVEAKTVGYLVITQGVPLEGMHMVDWLKTGTM